MWSIYTYIGDCMSPIFGPTRYIAEFVRQQNIDCWSSSVTWFIALASHNVSNNWPADPESCGLQNSLQWFSWPLGKWSKAALLLSALIHLTQCLTQEPLLNPRLYKHILWYCWLNNTAYPTYPTKSINRCFRNRSVSVSNMDCFSPYSNISKLDRCLSHLLS